jgi:small neutral amino acid transporter SnatA (MarC family)
MTLAVISPVKSLLVSLQILKDVKKQERTQAIMRKKLMPAIQYVIYLLMFAKLYPIR